MMLRAAMRSAAVLRYRYAAAAAASAVTSAASNPTVAISTKRPFPRSIAQRRALATDAVDEDPTPASSTSHVTVSSGEGDGVLTVTMSRPKVMNALDATMTRDIVSALRAADEDPTVRCIVLSGYDRAFAAGNDVSESAGRSFAAARFRTDAHAWIDAVAAVRTPIVAAVSGLALGAGCELAMAADIVIASEDAVFGQPDVQLGTIPGAGGTQRLVRAVGKAKAMEMVLTGRHMSAEEAESAGLITRIAKNGRVVEEAHAVAAIIASHSAPVVQAAVECINVAAEVSLAEGMRFERRAHQAAHALKDHDEGVRAWMDKRTPHWQHK
jgi:enoyl-CoA hydratase